MSVLVIDDDDKVLNLFERFMAIRKIKGKFAISSDKGIEIFEQSNEDFKILIIDLTIEGSYSSIESIAKIKEKNPDTHVFVITGGLFDSYKEDLDKFTNLQKVQKPFSFNELMDSIEKILG